MPTIIQEFVLRHRVLLQFELFVSFFEFCSISVYFFSAWQFLFSLIILGRTVTNNGSPCATGLMSCLSVLSVTLVYSGQTVGWIKMPLGTEVLLGPGHIVFDGGRILLVATSTKYSKSKQRHVPIGPRKETQQLPHFRPMFIVAKRPPIWATAELLSNFNALTRGRIDHFLVLWPWTLSYDVLTSWPRWYRGKPAYHYV